jgi:hypothetical protein
MFRKDPFVVESFINIGSFNCDCTQTVFQWAILKQEYHAPKKTLQRKTKMCILQLKKNHVNKSFKTPLIHK